MCSDGTAQIRTRIVVEEEEKTAIKFYVRSR